MRLVTAIALLASAASAGERAGIDVSVGGFVRQDLALGPSLQVSAAGALGAGFSLGGVLAYGQNRPTSFFADCADCPHLIAADTLRAGPALRYTLDLPKLFVFAQASPQYAADFERIAGGFIGKNVPRFRHGWDVSCTAGLGARLGSFRVGAQVEAVAGPVQGLGASLILGWRLGTP